MRSLVTMLSAASVALMLSGGAWAATDVGSSIEGSVEIAYFGLSASRHGRGLGRAMLECAIGEARAWGTANVWLHTCTLDGPRALPNYLARGFVPFKRETYEANIEP